MSSRRNRNNKPVVESVESPVDEPTAEIETTEAVASSEAEVEPAAVEVESPSVPDDLSTKLKKVYKELGGSSADYEAFVTAVRETIRNGNVAYVVEHQGKLRLVTTPAPILFPADHVAQRL